MLISSFTYYDYLYPYSCKMEAHCSGYNTRKRKVDYRKLNEIEGIPRKARRKRSELYPVEVVEHDTANAKVKIHYIGYSSNQDEWRNAADIVDCTPPKPLISLVFSLYQELALKIKRSLQGSRKASPEVRIEMDFDDVMFDGGLKQAGKLKKVQRGVNVYSISAYGDLDCLLGSKWFIRCFNSNGDFGYAILRTVNFMLKKRRPLVEYRPTQDAFEKLTFSQGYCLVFTFVRGDGVASGFQTIFSMS